ncbi:2,3-diketo-5-methylthiopentyl-1-phosphate enolase [Leptospirillum ferriphilum]|jgi:2,3-diketo-5-methylthiopentyl-1-phosphate enolase|uniref:2,3-diketo-5-methylthiopentyl-1-phosphate enolase n=3 Tax=Leptospirillum TaxID=179 RepID=A0A094W984_9BACT|nr:2,3-diketo-5-methylthiopentyl-1-phosphate enolase [Leptospirillum ferriphilum]AFS54280.1 ribulose 1,5-bisphosphate carboxylase, large subunit [Leptospirillum ferriphilum ML-04]EDZ40332.1 MAG: Ribulose-bisphosphate carboxylase [Leptospirillum sp. Group II '5-way CG']KGA94073.1 2,3-diketo-5-methylthiopentyl-1-phosphate enolase [Leptospirillum ferriphilum]
MEEIVVTYRFGPGADPAKEARIIAVGQTAGTWDERWSSRSADLGRHLGKVQDVRSVEGGFEADVAFPALNVPDGVGALLTMIYGKYSLSGRSRIVDVRLPEEWGLPPRFGIQGIRQRTGVRGRPLFMGIFKPSLGLSPSDLAKILGETAEAGLDIIKDDEIMPDLPGCTALDRIRACRPVLEKARQKRPGQGAMLYAVNLSGSGAGLHEKARLLVKEGANALLLSAPAYGYALLEELASDPEVGVPLFVHPAFAGAYSGASDHGLDWGIVLGTLPVRAGADAVLYPAHYGSLPFSSSNERRIVGKLRQGGVLPVPSAGIHPGILPRLMDDYGPDVALNAGTGIMDHPMGPAAGVRAFFEALDRWENKESFEPGSIPGGPLKAAVGKWGT